MERIQPKMMWASYNDNFCTTIVFCKSSTNASVETNITTPWHWLFSLVRHIPNHNVLIIDEYMNAQIGTDGNKKLCLRNCQTE